MTPFQGRELELYTEAMRTVPAMMAARLRGADGDAVTLLRAFHERAADLAIPRSSAWAVLYSASQVQIQSLVNLVSDIQNTDPEEVVERMIQATVEQVASGAL